MRFEEKTKKIFSVLKKRKNQAGDRQIEIIFENYIYFDKLISDFSKKKKKTPLLVKAALYCALSEILFYSDNVDGMTVNNAVNYVKSTNFMYMKGFAQAFLSHVVRNKKEIIAAQGLENDLAVKYSHPHWMVERWTNLFGRKNTEKLLKFNNEIPDLYIIVNKMRVNVNRYYQTLDEARIDYDVYEGFEEVLKINDKVSVKTLPGYSQGHFWVQDPSAYLISALVPKTSGLILDMCCSPGGKSFALLNQGDVKRIVCNDVSLNKLKKVCENASRLGFKSNLNFMVSNGAISPFKTKFDLILLDAPCSGLGVVNRKGDIRCSRSEQDMDELVKIQRLLLEKASILVEKGGYIVYSTCTLEPKENQEIIKRFLSRHDEFEKKSFFNVKLADMAFIKDGYYQTFPFEHKINGAFAALLKRKE